jgi:hypothetical protein
MNKLHKIDSNYSYECLEAISSIQTTWNSKNSTYRLIFSSTKSRKYAKYNPLKQKLIGAMEESHTKEQSLKIVSEMELRANRSKISGLGPRTQARERATMIFSGGKG